MDSTWLEEIDLCCSIRTGTQLLISRQLLGAGVMARRNDGKIPNAAHLLNRFMLQTLTEQLYVSTFFLILHVIASRTDSWPLVQSRRRSSNDNCQRKVFSLLWMIRHRSMNSVPKIWRICSRWALLWPHSSIYLYSCYVSHHVSDFYYSLPRTLNHSCVKGLPVTRTINWNARGARSSSMMPKRLQPRFCQRS